jgi:hypothetical protein
MRADPRSPAPCSCGSPASHPPSNEPDDAPDWPCRPTDPDGAPLLDPEETTDTPPDLIPADTLTDAEQALCRSFRHSGWQTQRESTLRALRSAGYGPARLERFVSCGDTAFVLTTGGDNPLYRIASNRCHDRFCIPCSTEKRRLIAANLTTHLKEGPLRLLTLTLRSCESTLSDRLATLYACFRRLRGVLYRKKMLVGGIAFLEITRNEISGFWHPHLHVICEGKFIPQAWVRDRWLEITGDSYIVDVRLIRGKREAASYVLKYATKAISARVWRNHDALVEAITSLSGKRTFNVFGSWTGLNLSHVPASDLAWEYLCTLPDLIRRYRKGDSSAGSILHTLCNGDEHDPLPSDFSRSPPGEVPML